MVVRREAENRFLRGEEEREEFDERVVHITRVSKVVKGGRHFGFRVVVVVGNHRGSVGLGVGKARGVREAIEKATEKARKRMVQISLQGTTIPHPILVKYGAAKVLMKPAAPGTGVIAGGGVRAVVEAAGVRDILSKSLGSSSVINVARATMKGLQQLKEVEVEAQRRGKSVEDLSPPWRKADVEANV